MKMQEGRRTLEDEIYYFSRPSSQLTAPRPSKLWAMQVIFVTPRTFFHRLSEVATIGATTSSDRKVAQRRGLTRLCRLWRYQSGHHDARIAKQISSLDGAIGRSPRLSCVRSCVKDLFLSHELFA
jgi:hypothetical protein